MSFCVVRNIEPLGVAAGNQLSDNDSVKIAEALRNNQSLVALDLSYNHFGEEGGVQIAQGLVGDVMTVF